MFHVGLDIHTMHISICALSEAGKQPTASGCEASSRIALSLLRGQLQNDRNDAERLAER
jgi:hypothetical protein